MSFRSHTRLLSLLNAPLLSFLFASVISGVHGWESALYDATWSPTPALSFETDKIVQDFSFAGYRRGEVPLPVNPPGATFDVTTYGADASGATDSTNAIQTAIDAAEAAGGGIVWMPAGTYRVSPQGGSAYSLRIDSDGVVLRGAGVGQTFLLNTETVMRSKFTILITGPSSAAWATQTSPTPTITTDLTGPTTQIPVDDSSGLSVGDSIIVRADPGDGWALEHNEDGWVGYGAGGFGRLLYFREIVAIDPGTHTLTLDIPTRYALKTRDAARVYRKPTMIREVGLQDFSIGNVQHPGTSGWGDNDYTTSGTSAYDVHASYAIRMSRTRDSWIRNVHTFRPAGNTSTCHILNNGILLSECAHATVRDCHFQRPQYGGGGGAGYMYRLQNCNDCLIQDSTAEFSRHGFVFSHMGSCGNVLHACLDKTTGKQTGNTGNQNTSGKGSDHHMLFSHSNLVDACTADDSWFEARYRPFGSAPLHNLTSAHTVFWNTEGKPSSRSYVVHSQQSRFGYAIGTRGAVTTVKTDGTSTAKTNPVDHVEGEGLGDTLTPFSLFREQRRRRLSLPSVAAIAEQTVFFPGNRAQVSPTVQFGDSTVVPPDASVTWLRTSGPGTADLQNPTGFDIDAAFTYPGTHTLEFTVSRHGSLDDDFAASTPAIVHVLPPGWQESELLPVADAYVQSGNPDTNYNSGSLWMKYVGSTATVNREIFMRFDLGSLAGRTIESATLELRATDPDFSATAETHLVTDDAWTETGITWNTRPAIGALQQTWPLSPDYVQKIDLTSAVATESAGDGLLSLRHGIVSQTNNATVFKYGSRTAIDPATRPRLRVVHREVWPAFVDWISGFPSVPVADRDPADDPDGDGLTNLEEYARRTPPHQAGSGPPLLGAERPASQMQLRLAGGMQLPRGVYPVVEHTATLTPRDWQPVLRGMWQVSGSDLVFHPPTSMMATPTGFFRLRLQVVSP